MDTVRTPRVARLRFVDGRVVVPPEDYDLLAVAAEKAAELFRAPVERERRIDHFCSSFLVPVREWCEAHAGQVRACHVTRPSEAVEVYVNFGRRRYDFALSRAFCGLKLQLHDAGWMVSGGLVPEREEGEGCMFDTCGALEVYADR